MEQHFVKIKSIDKVTHNVLKIVTEKPQGYTFTPGQATEVSINKKGWQNEIRPFTFTCLPDDDYLEFTIKTYPAHKGVTNELLQLKQNDELILHDVFGAIAYEGEGVFIAGGAGVTPFISILRFLRSRNEIGSNKLIFANKRKEDIILKQEFESLLGENFINILSDEKTKEYAHGYITKEFLKPNIADLNKKIYLCGPDAMMESVEKHLSDLGIQESSIIKEEF
ncbi:MAG TPA: flavodoxin reductase [Chitinophagaceae bacterium]|jgi:ferredoxin-NADP reductase|nr:flavodoxin reductase [Chitinophagaceae bacterium]